MKKTWIVVLIIVIVAVGAWLIFGTNKGLDTSKTIKVGVSQYMSHVALDAVRAGVVTGFEKAGYKDGVNVIFDFQNAQGDTSTNVAIAQKFANSGYDLIIPLGTQAAQAVANLVKERPIVFGAVTDPIGAKLVKTLEVPGGNITGTNNITLYKESLELLTKLVPKAKKIGLVYNPGEANGVYGLEQTKKIGEPMGFTFITAVANNTSEVLSASLSIADKVDAFYMMPDNTVIAGQEALIKVANEAKKPLIAITQAGVEKGALAAVGTNFEMVGERTVEVALRVLKGEKPANIPVLKVTDADLFINTTTAQKIGVTIPQELISQAKQIYK